MQTLDCKVGQCAHVKFVNDTLIFSETIDIVQIYDTATYSQRQIIDVFGMITGFDTCEDSLFIGVQEDSLSCIMEYTCKQAKGID